MEEFIIFIGMLITIPFIILEVIIKCVLLIVYFPLLFIIAVFYPFIKKYDLNWLKKWWKYATKWSKGFYSVKIYQLWEVT